MMKKTLIALLLIGSNFLWAQKVGINTETPTETLDVNGKLRVRTVETDLTNETQKLAVTSEGVIIKKSMPPANQEGIIEPGEEFNTGVDARQFAPTMIKFIIHGSPLGYKFAINKDNHWVLTIENHVYVSTGSQYIEYEILWLNR